MMQMIDQAYKHKQAGLRRNKGNLQFLLGNIFDHDHLFWQMTNCQCYNLTKLHICGIEWEWACGIVVVQTMESGKYWGKYFSDAHLIDIDITGKL